MSHIFIASCANSSCSSVDTCAHLTHIPAIISYAFAIYIMRKLSTFLRFFSFSIHGKSLEYIADGLYPYAFLFSYLVLRFFFYVSRFDVFFFTPPDVYSARCEKRQLTCPFWNLLQASRHVGDLFEDLRDGHNLISLLEVLSGEHLVSTCFSGRSF